MNIGNAYTEKRVFVNLNKLVDKLGIMKLASSATWKFASIPFCNF